VSFSCLLLLYAPVATTRGFLWWNTAWSQEPRAGLAVLATTGVSAPGLQSLSRYTHHHQERFPKPHPSHSVAITQRRPYEPEDPESAAVGRGVLQDPQRRSASSVGDGEGPHRPGRVHRGRQGTVSRQEPRTQTQGGRRARDSSAHAPIRPGSHGVYDRRIAARGSGGARS
jgi:hypothetical protein